MRPSTVLTVEGLWSRSKPSDGLPTVLTMYAVPSEGNECVNGEPSPLCASSVQLILELIELTRRGKVVGDGNALSRAPA
jgi:hypothetical protein